MSDLSLYSDLYYLAIVFTLEVVIGDGYVYTDVVGDDNGDVVGDDNGYVTGDGNGDVVGDTLPVKSLPSFSATDAA